MGELQIQHPFSLPPPPLPPLPPPSPSRDDSAPPKPSSRDDNSPPPAPPFDPSRIMPHFLIYELVLYLEVIGIIKRMAMIKELAAAYHAECLTYCQELLELQKNVNEASDGCLWEMSQLSLEEPLVDELIPFDAYTVDCSKCDTVINPFTDIKLLEEPRKEVQRPAKRDKKSR
ncbi:hypothetical protein SASPL_124189 [Salvia splendens]|uniref:Uncharacterized protein n=1 Tax=Salvia splendens TaxID=180675 RepID=A0A8X8XMF4_SALSN|nr:hypothetical protein SASPL_124189 [Salvia splendens]